MLSAAMSTGKRASRPCIFFRFVGNSYLVGLRKRSVLTAFC